MALLVHKYGGTSVGTVDRIRKVADRVVEHRKQGHDIGGGPLGDEWRKPIAY